jgi:hypothetical protein
MVNNNVKHVMIEAECWAVGRISNKNGPSSFWVGSKTNSIFSTNMIGQWLSPVRN